MSDTLAPEWRRALELLRKAEGMEHDDVAPALWVAAAQVHATLAVVDALERLMVRDDAA